MFGVVGLGYPFIPRWSALKDSPKITITSGETEPGITGTLSKAVLCTAISFCFESILQTQNKSNRAFGNHRSLETIYAYRHKNNSCKYGSPDNHIARFHKSPPVDDDKYGYGGRKEEDEHKFEAE